jgi:hypothetical protein
MAFAKRKSSKVRIRNEMDVFNDDGGFLTIKQEELYAVDKIYGKEFLVKRFVE